MKVAAHAAHRTTLPAAEKTFDWKGAVLRALKNDQGLDVSAIPKKVLNKIGDWTDTTQTYSKAFIGKDAVYVHVDDMLANHNRDEGFIAANAAGVVVASGSINQDSKGNYVLSSAIFDKKPTGMGDVPNR
jgi:hypothetical protein